MSNVVSRGFSALFGPDRPRWACELAPGAAVVVEVSPDRRRVASAASAPLPDDAVRPGVRGRNVEDPRGVEGALARALDEAGFSGSELVLVVPDGAARVGLLRIESMPSRSADQESFIRWKLRKNVPFDVNAARVVFEKLDANGAVDLLTIVSPLAVMEEYESVVDALGIHPGVVVLSTLAALNLLDGDSPVDEALFVKSSRAAIVTTIVKGGRLRFYRRLPRPVSLEDAIYPTLMYYQDKLGEGAGGGIGEVILCSETGDGDDVAACGDRLGVRPRPLHPAGVRDAYKPALGALWP